MMTGPRLWCPKTPARPDPSPPEVPECSLLFTITLLRAFIDYNYLFCLQPVIQHAKRSCNINQCLCMKHFKWKKKNVAVGQFHTLSKNSRYTKGRTCQHHWMLSSNRCHIRVFLDVVTYLNEGYGIVHSQWAFTVPNISPSLHQGEMAVFPMKNTSVLW